MAKHTQASCAARWAATKARGNPTLAEIESIDSDTPWSELEPTWWLEMMDVQRALRGQTT